MCQGNVAGSGRDTHGCFPGHISPTIQSTRNAKNLRQSRSWLSSSRPASEQALALVSFCGVRKKKKKKNLSCGLDFESAVTAQNDEFKVVFDSSYSRLVNVKT